MALKLLEDPGQSSMYDSWSNEGQTIGWDQFRDRYDALSTNISQVVVTTRRTIDMALLGLFAGGHILLEDLPGVGKTLLAKTIAQSIAGQFSRIQFTPDLLPTDITGTSIYDMPNNRFDFVPGPIFANIVLADELNRTGPRTQSALLEAMAEFQVTTDRTVRHLPRPFMVIATQNLVESYGTFPLPNSQLDRFLVAMEIGLPTAVQEMEILNRSEHGLPTVEPVLTVEEVMQMQDPVRQVQVAVPVKQYIANLLAATRTHASITVGASPRGGVALMRASQGWAAFQGRDFVVPEDIKEIAPYVLSHRVISESSYTGSAGMAGEAIREILGTVPVPV